ncbi:MAG: hypothetical protein HC836_03560 [Richelia sp. RM2_1_2]|nr:hypothetical protein [Richelia sp. SM1_7_0]NJN07392.1 hypothetical protein [Richelia sp. RM1_1_1]NJO29192.1 hypothetical protein [Richelia sp. SL_2_1]NJO57483.1 hypothetical protein [Richelia sp. RM2_1_2]NJS16975.1 hypothetical protein [Nostocaceae cyanobacterium CSU_2_110]
MNKNPFVKFKNGKIVSVEHPTTASFEETKDYREKSTSGPKISGIFYLITLLLVNGGIWIGAFIYLSTAKPKYVSEWTINIPGSGSTSNINLPNIGQATSQNYSAYAGANYDPRENYKAIATAEEVLSAAALNINMPLKEFGNPRIKTVDNTSLMKFEFQGSTPQQAKNKLVALQNAFEVKLEQLRFEEISQEKVRLESGMEVSRRKLIAAQKRLSAFKVASGLNSEEQLSNLAINIEGLRKQRAELTAQGEQSQARMLELSNNLNLSSNQASDAFVLQADPLFQNYLKNYSETTSQLITSSAKLTSVHPTIINFQREQEASQNALLARAQALLNRPISMALINRLNFSNNESSGSKRAMLSEQLVTTSVEKQGTKAQIETLDTQISQLEQRLEKLSQQQSVMEDLKRDVQVAEAVFSSTIAKLDLAKTTVSASYPQIQILAKPSLPTNASGPRKNLVLLGATLGSLLLTSGIIGLWKRQSQQQKQNQNKFKEYVEYPEFVEDSY